MVVSTSAPVESKVKAGAAGAGVGAAAAAAVVWVLDAHVHTPGVEGDLPAPVGALVIALVAYVTAWGSAWLAKHTPRPDDVR